MDRDEAEARTDLLRARLGLKPPLKPVRVVCTGSRDALSRPAGQFMLATVVTAVSRIGTTYRWPELDIPGDIPCRLPWLGDGPLLDALTGFLAGMWDAKPISVDGPIVYTISIGETGSWDPSLGTTCGAVGWTAYWGDVNARVGELVAPSAAVRAAAGAVSRMFSATEHPGAAGGAVAFSMIHHAPGECAEPYTGSFAAQGQEWVLAGCGALGHALTWCLVMEPGRPEKFTLFDEQAIKRSNLNRYMWATSLDVDERKVEHLGSILREHGWTVDTRDESSDTWDGEGKLPAVVFAALDDSVPRRNLQKELPTWLINGGTGDETYTISRHWAKNVLAEQPCLGCLYPSTAPRPVGCDEQDSVEEPDSPSISFLSLACGAEMAAEVELVAAGLRGPNEAVQRNIFNEEFATATLPRRVARCGICNDPLMARIWEKRRR